MAIYAISDLHLSFGIESKPMDIFGEHWSGYLEKIEENGFEAYIVGGYVRDHLLGIDTGDIDICTNARVKDLLEIFNDISSLSTIPLTKLK